MPPPRSAKPAPSAPPPNEILIAGRFAVDVGRPVAGAGGGLPAFAVIDRRDRRSGLMAVQARAHAPPRAPALATLMGPARPGVLTPLAHGPAPGADGKPAWFVVCPMPPGPALWPSGGPAPKPWSDTDLVGRLLRPAAAALAMLAAQRVTHRAVRPDNMFLDPGEAAEGVVLGCAWAGPPAALQPAVFEPPYAAMCPPAARGEGEIADDVYALGVVMLTLALGRMPLAGLDDTAIIRRKLEMGCFQALAGDARLSPLIGDLVKGMLAQDPQHRPLPAMLADPATARARHVAARPPRRAPRSLDVAGSAVWDTRTLAFAIARHPEPAVKMLRLGVVDHWLRRVLTEAVPAARVEEAMARRNAEAGPQDAAADARLVMRVVAMLDPFAPLSWNGVSIWPDAFGAALAADGLAATDATAPPGTLRAAVEAVIANEALADWAAARPEHCDAQALREQARQQRGLLRQRGWVGGLPRLIYALNPLLPCRSPVLGTALVARVAELPAALEAAAARPEMRAQMPVDREIAAFIAAAKDPRVDGEILALQDSGPAGSPALAQLALLARLQAHFGGGPLPALAGWLAGHAAPLLEDWRNLATRRQRQAALAATIPAGDLRAVQDILDDPAARAGDEQAFLSAQGDLRRIDQRLVRLADGGADRAETARRLGQEIAASLGLAAVAVAAIAAALR